MRGGVDPQGSFVSKMKGPTVDSDVESWRTRLMRWGFNLHPTYWSTGGRVTFIAGDWSEVRVRLPLSWRTRNYVGTYFGGSMYSAVDPFYMIMLIKRLGPGYTVWDKAATIRFHKPGRSTLQAKFVVTLQAVEEIRSALTEVPKLNRVFTVEICDRDGTVHAVVEKTLHISRRMGSSAESKR
jgi:acyl-coenzyme A thioesterase PaaI-like protein